MRTFRVPCKPSVNVNCSASGRLDELHKVKHAVILLSNIYEVTVRAAPCKGKRTSGDLRPSLAYKSHGFQGSVIVSKLY